MSEMKIIVRIRDQVAELKRGNELIRTFRVSTAANGLSCEIGSNCTPTGLLRVAQKIGEGAPAGTVFRSRAATGDVWLPPNLTDEDLVLTRILWLEGCEPHNSNTFDRYIYFHGTNQEHLLGQSVSHGCIRLSNADIIDLYDLVPEGNLVEIAE